MRVRSGGQESHPPEGLVRSKGPTRISKRSLWWQERRFQAGGGRAGEGRVVKMLL